MWEPEPLVSPLNFKDSLRGDFRKTYKANSESLTVQVEVEMGNMASSYRNYFKFQLSYAHQLANLAVLILPTDSLSKRIDSGLASYEKTTREIPTAELSITVPILVIGINPTENNEFDVSTISNDMKIIKGATKHHETAHIQLVNNIIKLMKIYI